MTDTKKDAKLTDGRLSPGDRIDAPLWWHEQGLSQTASGYGAKLTTRWKIRYDGRIYRIYCTQYCNAGCCWILAKGIKIFFWDF